ncbi:amidohydrolase family protein [Bacteriovorax sp. DB6_IX]|uniref:amidohydrolase family protein n=1 Tax=Bacteriovorax sp. DB6_IX TaxID=1353530 RepID=UPI00038A4DFF|nr:amidohydrolase family protein [Bacteriovorax sp. DB6_IX]EQC51443.1 amidohydrolase family protein [Bacteriovorax sp. DB6_IX]
MNKLLVITSVFLLSSCSLLYNKLGGDFDYEPEQIDAKLSPAAKKMVADAFEGIDEKKLHDMHFHVVGLGNSDSGIEINPMMKMWWKHLGKYNRYNVYMSASGVTDKENADQQYIDRIVRLHKYMPMKFKTHILAFDRHYNADGTINHEHTEFYIPNEYIWKISQKYPEYFVPVMSVHPYRKDALIELEKWAKRGVKYIKWLPNAMGMDPAAKRVIPFYKMMKKYNMILLSHAGEEKAVEGEAYQALANPLKLRVPLDMGLKVLMAHLASRGKCKDYDNGDKVVDCFDLFWRMFHNKKYDDLLYSEISSLLIYERLGKPLDVILSNPQVHNRVGYGSDYPLPAINWIYRTTDLEEKGYITAEEKEIVDEIYRLNPLLFHFVLSRIVKHPKTGQKFTKEAFYKPEGV